MISKTCDESYSIHYPQKNFSATYGKKTKKNMLSLGCFFFDFIFDVFLRCIVVLKDKKNDFNVFKSRNMYYLTYFKI